MQATILSDVLSGAIDPALVFDLEAPFSGAAAGCAAVDERRAVKSLVRP